MSVTIEEIIEGLDAVFAATTFDESKRRFSAVRYNVESLYQDMKVHLMSKEDSAFLNKVRNTLPVPDTIRALKIVFVEFKHSRAKLTGATSGRWSAASPNRGNIPRSEAQNETFREVYAGDVSQSVHHGHVTHHTPACSPSYDSPSSDSGSGDCGGGGSD